MVTKLSPAEVGQFLKLYNALHLYTNERQHFLPDVRTLEELAELKKEDRLKLRDVLYDHPELIDRFVAENPAELTAEELVDVRGWSGFIHGDFYLLRHLKNYSVFLTEGEPTRAYGVIGLTNSIDEMFPSYALPIYMTTVLLPFRGRIVWDGLVTYQKIVFGPGIRHDLNESFQRVKQREGIIESLTSPGQAPAAARPRKAQPDLRPIAQQVVKVAERLRPGATPIQSRAYGLLRAVAQLADAATNDPSNLEVIGEGVRAISRAYKLLATAYEREVYEEHS